MVVDLVETGRLFEEFTSLLIVVVFFKLFSAVFAHRARLRHPTSQLIEFDRVLDQLQVLLRVVLLHDHRGLLVVVCLEAVICLTLNALHVHVERLPMVSGVFVAVCGLLVQLFRVVLPILLRREEIAEEASFENPVGFPA